MKNVGNISVRVPRQNKKKPRKKKNGEKQTLRQVKETGKRRNGGRNKAFMCERHHNTNNTSTRRRTDRCKEETYKATTDTVDRGHSCPTYSTSISMKAIYEAPNAAVGLTGNITYPA